MNRFLAVVGALVLGALSALPAPAAPLTFTAVLSGPAESPPNASPGTGFATVTIDSVADTMWVEVAFQDLVSGNTASHIHAATTLPFTGTAGVATTLPTFTGFPGGVTAGVYGPMFFDMTLASSYNPAFVTANGGIANAEAVLFAAIEGGRAYLNIHTTTFPGGEIRGFLAPVPEPGTMLLLGSGVAALGFRRRKGA